jgi:hypothetical protein
MVIGTGFEHRRNGTSLKRSMRIHHYVVKEKFMKTMKVLFITGIVILGVAGAAVAQPRPNVYDGGNQWRITAYDDTSPAHQQWATQGICFLPYGVQGTAIVGVWYSNTFPNWRGRYAQEGDRVLMHGDYAQLVGHDGMVIDLFEGTSPQDEGAGQWTEWRETGAYGTTIGWANTRLRRAGKCAIPAGVDFAKMNRADIEKLAVELSGRVKPRLRKDGKPAESPLDRDQVPLPDEKQ